MGQYNYNNTWTFTSKNNLSSETESTGAIYKAISDETGDIAGSGQGATGILIAGVASGQTGTCVIAGISKFTASTAINSSGLPLTVTTSGYITIASNGNWIIGRSLGSANIAAGSVGIAHFNFASTAYVASGGAIY